MTLYIKPLKKHTVFEPNNIYSKMIIKIGKIEFSIFSSSATNNKIYKKGLKV